MAFTSNIQWIQAGESVTGADSNLDNNGVLNRPSVHLLANTIDNKNRIDAIESSLDNLITNPGSPIIHNHNTAHTNIQGGDNSSGDNSDWEFYHVTQNQFNYLQNANQPGGVLLIDGNGKVDRNRIPLYKFVLRNSQNPSSINQEIWQAYTFDSFFPGIGSETGFFISFFSIYYNPIGFGTLYLRNPHPNPSDGTIPSISSDPFIRNETDKGSSLSFTTIAERSSGSDAVIRLYSSLPITDQNQLIITSVGCFKISP